VLAPAEVVEAIVIDAEVVGDLVNDRVPHELGEVGLAPRPRLQRAPEQRDAVGQMPAAEVTFGTGDALVEAEQQFLAVPDGVGGWDIRDGDLHVVEVGEQIRRQRGDGIVDETVEAGCSRGSEAIDGSPMAIRIGAAKAHMTIVHERSA